MLLGREDSQLHKSIFHLDYAFSPSMNKGLHTALISIFINGSDPLFHSFYDSIRCSENVGMPSNFLCAYIHSLVSINVQQVLMNASGCHFFLHGGIQGHAFVSYTLPHQIPFCQTAPLLPSVTQQHVMEYWQ